MRAAKNKPEEQKPLKEGEREKEKGNCHQQARLGFSPC